MCGGKRLYFSEEDAERHAKKINRAGVDGDKKNGKRMRSYRCPICTAWHLTSQERNPMVARRSQIRPRPRKST